MKTKSSLGCIQIKSAVFGSLIFNRAISASLLNISEMVAQGEFWQSSHSAKCNFNVREEAVMTFRGHSLFCLYQKYEVVGRGLDLLCNICKYKTRTSCYYSKVNVISKPSLWSRAVLVVHEWKDKRLNIILEKAFVCRAFVEQIIIQ